MLLKGVLINGASVLQLLLKEMVLNDGDRECVERKVDTYNLQLLLIFFRNYNLVVFIEFNIFL